MNATIRTARRWILLSACAGLLASACATLDKDECRNADWHTLGYTDGTQGRLPQRVDAYRKDCAEHGVRPDLAAYRQGREEGLLEYCRERNGYRIGARGHKYAGVCPADLEIDFMAGYRVGRELHDLESDVRSLATEIDGNESDIEELEEALRSAEAELVNDGVAKDRRVELLSLTRELSKDIGSRQTQLRQLERDLARKEIQLNEARLRNPYQ